MMAVHGTRGAVAAVENEGALAAAEILRRRGNAADASIAGAFVQTVVDPCRTSIGGAAHIQYHSATTGRAHLINSFSKSSKFDRTTLVDFRTFVVAPGR